MELDNRLKSHFLNLYYMTLSDVDVDPLELELLYLIGEEKGITKDDIEQIVINPASTKFTCPESVLEKVESLYDFARIAWADGKIDDNEITAMQMFIKKFGFKEDNIPMIVQFLLDEAEKQTPKNEIFRIVSESL